MADDWELLDASIAALDALTLEIENAQVEEFENVTGQMLPMRDDQVENNAGGFVFQVSDETRVRRFLILGTNGGTYYVGQDQLHKEAVEDLIKIIEKGKGDMILKEIYQIVQANRAPKRDFAIYATALCCRYKTQDWQKQKENQKLDNYLAKLQKTAFKLVPIVCRISTDLFMFLKYAEEISKEHGGKTGWGRMMKTAVAHWYFKREPKQLAMQLTKYKNRCGYTHRDALRLCHADPQSKKAWENSVFYDYLFHYAISGKLDKTFAERYTDDKIKMVHDSETASFMEAVVKAASLKVEDEEECAKLIKEHGLVREHIPTELLNSATVWEALLEKMPMTALIRNLAKMSTLGLITGENKEHDKWVNKVVGDLTDEKKIQKVGIHPFSVLLAKAVYEHGQGIRGSLTFETNPVVLEALEQAFLLSFKNVKPTNKRFCLALDVSGSMCSPLSGSVLSCIDAECALSMTFLKTEPKVECVAFCGHLTPMPFTKDTSFQEFQREVRGLSFGSTDCALPMLYAKEKKKQFDVFVVMTDSETYFGNTHPFAALQQYRESSGIKDAKLIVIAFSGTKFTIADPTDAGMLDIAGFDSATPQLISEFINGRL